MSTRRAWKTFQRANLNHLRDRPAAQAQVVPRFTGEAQWLRNGLRRHSQPKTPIQAARLSSLGIPSMLSQQLQSQVSDNKLHK